MTKEEFREKIKEHEIQVCLNCPFNTCKSGGYACTYLNTRQNQYKKEIRKDLETAYERYKRKKDSATNRTQKSDC